jgi:hypothetical protein
VPHCKNSAKIAARSASHSGWNTPFWRLQKTLQKRCKNAVAHRMNNTAQTPQRWASVRAKSLVLRARQAAPQNAGIDTSPPAKCHPEAKGRLALARGPGQPAACQFEGSGGLLPTIDTARESASASQGAGFASQCGVESPFSSAEGQDKRFGPQRPSCAICGQNSRRSRFGRTPGGPG